MAKSAAERLVRERVLLQQGASQAMSAAFGPERSRSRRAGELRQSGRAPLHHSDLDRNEGIVAEFFKHDAARCRHCDPATSQTQTGDFAFDGRFALTESVSMVCSRAEGQRGTNDGPRHFQRQSRPVHICTWLAPLSPNGLLLACSVARPSVFSIALVASSRILPSAAARVRSCLSTCSLTAPPLSRFSSRRIARAGSVVWQPTSTSAADSLRPAISTLDSPGSRPLGTRLKPLLAHSLTAGHKSRPLSCCFTSSKVAKSCTTAAILRSPHGSPSMLSAKRLVADPRDASTAASTFLIMSPSSRVRVLNLTLPPPAYPSSTTRPSLGAPRNASPHSARTASRTRSTAARASGSPAATFNSKASRAPK
jgi:hypothetical protein